MSLPRYPEYKESEVHWLGETPSHWTICRYKTVFRERTERSINGYETLLSVSAYTGVSRRSEIIEEGDHLSRADSLEGYKVCYPGDLVMNIMLAWNRGLGFASEHGIVSPAYSVFEVVADADARFLDYLVRSDSSIWYYKAFSAGVIDSRLRLYPDTFGSLYCALPVVDEQRAVTTFLDRETAKIDALIAEQEKLLALLAEKRRATISHAVTRGLNPNAPMKDSGIPWLGEVPTHWEVGAVKRFFSSLDGRRVPLSAEDRGERQGAFPYYGASGVIDTIDDFIFDEDLVLVSEDGANLLNRSSPIAFVATGRYWVNNHAHILRPKDGAGALRFWAERIEAINLEPVVTGAAQPKLTVEALMNLPISAPPTSDERASIAAFVESEAGKLDALYKEAGRAILLLQERRSALISAAVTGKIDVRNAVPAEDLAA